MFDVEGFDQIPTEMLKHLTQKKKYPGLMFVSSHANGDFTLEAAELANRFGLSEHEFHRYVSLGEGFSALAW
ncbi:hypothetical protein ACOJBM_42360 [Rhizobium beringeri]